MWIMGRKKNISSKKSVIDWAPIWIICIRRGNIQWLFSFLNSMSQVSNPHICLSDVWHGNKTHVRRNSTNYPSRLVYNLKYRPRKWKRRIFCVDTYLRHIGDVSTLHRRDNNYFSANIPSSDTYYYLVWRYWVFLPTRILWRRWSIINKYQDDNNTIWTHVFVEN